MPSRKSPSPATLTPAQEKITQAITLLQALGLPRQQHNTRSALALLALLKLPPTGSWQQLERPLLGITPIMEWCQHNYDSTYAPNSREQFRKSTVKPFVAAGIALRNPDNPTRPTTSDATCYQVASELFDVVQTFGTAGWEATLTAYLAERTTLLEQYAKAREMVLIPLVLAPGQTINLSPGKHSQLLKDIITEFGPRFAPGATLLYVGDTASRVGYFQREALAQLGVTLGEHGQMPDVILHDTARNWLLLIESVTSGGPVHGERHAQLSHLFAASTAGLVYVTAFPTRKQMGKYVADISWETEVWAADAPTHLIHFNGERYLGPYSSPAPDGNISPAATEPA